MANIQKFWHCLSSRHMLFLLITTSLSSTPSFLNTLKRLAYFRSTAYMESARPCVRITALSRRSSSCCFTTKPRNLKIAPSFRRNSANLTVWKTRLRRKFGWYNRTFLQNFLDLFPIISSCLFGLQSDVTSFSQYFIFITGIYI